MLKGLAKSYFRGMLNVAVFGLLSILIDRLVMRPSGLSPTPGFPTAAFFTAFLVRYTLFWIGRSILYWPVFGPPTKKMKAD